MEVHEKKKKHKINHGILNSNWCNFLHLLQSAL